MNLCGGLLKKNKNYRFYVARVLQIQKWKKSTW